MATIDLRELSGDDFVLHFGGRPNNVDAFTFANSLLSISEALREINQQIKPDFSLEIDIASLGTGSFRARLKTRAKKLSKLLGHPMRELIIAVLATWLARSVKPLAALVPIQQRLVRPRIDYPLCGAAQYASRGVRRMA